MNGWTGSEVKLAQQDQVIGASVTAQAITDEFRLSCGGATKGLRVDITATTVTVAVGITVKLQHSSKSGVWEDMGAPKTATISAAGEFSILFHEGVAADAAYMPFKVRCRAVITTGAGDAATITSVRVLQEL